MSGCVMWGLLKECPREMLSRSTFTVKWQCPVKALFSDRLVM